MRKDKAWQKSVAGQYLRLALEEVTDPRVYAEAMEMTVEEVAEWTMRPEVSRLLRGAWRPVIDGSQAGLLRELAKSVKRLALLRDEGEEEETRRKASVDLLRAKIEEPALRVEELPVELQPLGEEAEREACAVEVAMSMLREGRAAGSI